MRLNIEAINKLIDSQYRGNTTWFADEIGVNRSYLTMILNGKQRDDSSKVIKHLVTYCEKKHLNYRNYIFLP